MLNDVLVYEGENFEVCNRRSRDWFQEQWRRGAIIERRMPCPTRRHPERTKSVYFWIGETTAWLRDRSCEMPASVTELAAQGRRVERAFAASYIGIMISGRRAITVPA